MLGALALLAGLACTGAARAGDPPPTNSAPAVAPAATASPLILEVLRADDERPVADPPQLPTPAAVLRAKELYNQGTALVQKGDLKAAFRAFRGSYEQDGGTEALANMAVIEKELGRPRAAAEHLDAAMARLPFSQAEKMGELKQHLAEICKEIAVLHLRVTAAESQVYVDHRWLGGGPLTRTVYLDPGDVTVVVRASGTEVRRRLSATKGASEVMTIGDADVKALAPAAMPSASVPAAPPDDGSHQRNLWILGGVGAAFLAVGIVGVGVYARAHDERTKIERETAQLGGFCGAPPTPGFVDDCHARDQEAWNETVGAVLGIVGGAGLGGLGMGVLVAALSGPDAPPAPKSARAAGRKGTSARVQVVPVLGGVILQGEF